MMFIAAKINDVDMLRLRDRVLTAPVFGGTYGDFPWDRFEAAALEAGVLKDLANFGRAIFREAYQHDWSDELKVECGWLDGGQRLVYQAFAFPEDCRARWQHLLETDGVPDDVEVPPVTIDPYDLADGLEAVGIKTNFMR
ncbi:hypothetical protein PA01_18320 [Azoarcus sp. PA01]|nr:hypothetical protein PA01_19565 [Azoarcus sp. PA01]KAI5913741.1 hypothetical protein PA01_18320 [Azoarcus sp. PA01]